MNVTKTLARNIAFAGAVALMLSSSAFAQNRSYPGTYGQQWGDRGFANRNVEGTVASVVHFRAGDRVRLTSGMELFVPSSITSMNEGRRFGASSLQPGDVVRMNVYSREGDGRDAQVRSIELVRSGFAFGNDHRMSGTIITLDRRGRSMLLRTDSGRTVAVDFSAYAGRGEASPWTFHRGDRISVSGRFERGSGNVVADDIRLWDSADRDRDGYRH